MATDYSKLDEAILDEISSGRKRSFIHLTRLLLLAANAAPARTDWRVVDGRLKALRAAGRIEWWSKTGWSLVEGEKS